MVSTACNLEQVELGSGRMGNGTGGSCECMLGRSILVILIPHSLWKDNPIIFFLPWTNL